MNTKKAVIILAALAAMASGSVIWLLSRAEKEQVVPAVDYSAMDRVAVIAELAAVDRDRLRLKYIDNSVIPGPDEETPYIYKDISLIKNTEFSRQTDRPKDEELLQAEWEEYREMIRGLEKEGKSTAFIESPGQYVPEPISLSDLETGSRLRIYAWKDGDNLYADKVIVTE